MNRHLADSRLKGAFTLLELLVVISIIVLLVALLLPSLAASRDAGKLVVSESNLKQMSVATGSYAADYQDMIFSFSWRNGETYLMANEDGDIEPTQMILSDMCAAGAQAIDILRRRADRVGEGWIEHQECWIPHVLYSHLVIQDYLASRLPELMVVDPNDRVRLNWQIEPLAKFDKGFWLPLQPDPIPSYRRWPYSSSYQVVPATYDPLQSDPRDKPELNTTRMLQSNTHYQYVIPGASRFKTMLLTDVAHPGAKVHLHDSHDRHFSARPAYFGLEGSRLPLAFFDASVSVERTADANPGWRPSAPKFLCMNFFYAPNAWEPPTIGGDATEMVKGYYRWTRGGLRGIDFGGMPLDTGQPTPGECDL
jgi:prepilin-type N-terminal cleavage/methylation domain-containing protein